MFSLKYTYLTYFTNYIPFPLSLPLHRQAGCGVPDCTTVAQRVPLTLARSTCQLDCSRNVGCAGTTAFPRSRHRCTAMYIPLRQPLSRSPPSLISIPMSRVVSGVWRVETRLDFWTVNGTRTARVHRICKTPPERDLSHIKVQRSILFSPSSYVRNMNLLFANFLQTAALPFR
ncbi:hypothetical protein PUN28_011765 [Cardiocondyla obscurior]|uniref:Uncharacterized protein n=1 Tax=Cardiocondyla obscurior TaxID=286306 RepID=A0AAW2FI09_9HYME